MSRKNLAMLVLGSALAASPSLADPVVGVGLTFWFGPGQSQTQTGIGLRVFSNDEDGSVVGSVGVDYILQGGAVRPTLGIAYLQDNAYLGLDLGFDLNGGPLQYGAGLGVTNTADEPVVVTQTPPVVTPPVVTTPPVTQTPVEEPTEEEPPVDEGEVCAEAPAEVADLVFLAAAAADCQK